jgi:hypothetical protein
MRGVGCHGSSSSLPPPTSAASAPSVVLYPPVCASRTTCARLKICLTRVRVRGLEVGPPVVPRSCNDSLPRLRVTPGPAAPRGGVARSAPAQCRLSVVIRDAAGYGSVHRSRRAVRRRARRRAGAHAASPVWCAVVVVGPQLRLYVRACRSIKETRARVPGSAASPEAPLRLDLNVQSPLSVIDAAPARGPLSGRARPGPETHTRDRAYRGGGAAVAVSGTVSTLAVMRMSRIQITSDTSRCVSWITSGARNQTFAAPTPSCTP